MKKIFILFLFVVSNIGLSAQNSVLNFNQRGISVKEEINTPAFDKKSSWTEVRTNLFDETVFDVSTYTIDGDTVIDSKTYSKLFINNKFYTALRESEDNKIYACFPWLDPDRELLIYDFDWYPDKTLYAQLWDYEDDFVQAVLGSSIDSVQLLDGKYYKYVDRGTFRYGKSSIIRGIGSTVGFFISTFQAPTNGDQYALLCFYIDNVLVYSNSYFNYCNTGSVNIITDNDSKIKVYPNPSDNIVTIEFLENLKIDTLKIFDIKGSLIRTYEVKGKNKIEVQDLVKGIYMYSAIIENNQNLSGKIII